MQPFGLGAHDLCFIEKYRMIQPEMSANCMQDVICLSVIDVTDKRHNDDRLLSAATNSIPLQRIFRLTTKE
jgi:hypothetical protein